MAKRKLHYDPQRDYYDILGINPAAGRQEVQQRYRELAKQLHPDVNPDRVEWATEQFQRLTEAYNVLNNPRSRSDYDDLRWLAGKPRASEPNTSQERWWEQPHPKQPGGYQPRYEPIRPIRPIQRPGAWLVPLHLGFLRPFYAAIVDLMRSPYRYVLTILGIVLLINLIFIMATLANYERDEDAATPQNTVQPTAQPVSGLIPNTTLSLVDCYPEVTLLVRSVEPVGQGYEVNAEVYPAGTLSRNALLFPAQSVTANHATIRGEPFAVRLQFADSDTPHVSRIDSLEAGGLQPGNYVLQWTPDLPGTGKPEMTCTHSLTITNE